MFVPFEALSPESKVWIYPSNRKFYPNEIEEIQSSVRAFIENWKKEDTSFQASFEFKYDRFIVIAADDSESQLSVGDIDASVAFILELQNRFEVVLLDKLNVCFKQGEFVQYKDLKEFKKLIKQNSVSKKTIIFDNLVSNLEDYSEVWEIPITESWYNRFF